ncbi:hypothetical protein BCR32DRAFT_281128 [Anaeromyces robustus]|uniref:Uncharacterized protein n=1 Tax=Anaeromyces robustus TaxID=1754192 RepID=A0A1Y1X1S2_9FUNG|nr:hypothetical protein BCR32DRAFT_281128 [Anaeromyces robustus]|eukprot:ORX79750.1 hypothetical protein BCR32DRAFT_281128 [Anaeromyces robustus]
MKYLQHYNNLNYKKSPYLSSLYNNTSHPQYKTTTTQSIPTRGYNYSQNQQLNSLSNLRNQEAALHSYIPPLTSSYTKQDYISDNDPSLQPTSILMHQNLNRSESSNALKYNQYINSKTTDLKPQPYPSLSNSVKNDNSNLNNISNNNNNNSNSNNNNNKNSNNNNNTNNNTNNNKNNSNTNITPSPMYLSELQNFIPVCNSSNKLSSLVKSNNSNNDLLKKVNYNIESGSIKTNTNSSFQDNNNHQDINLSKPIGDTLTNFKSNENLNSIHTQSNNSNKQLNLLNQPLSKANLKISPINNLSVSPSPSPQKQENMDSSVLYASTLFNQTNLSSNNNNINISFNNSPYQKPYLYNNISSYHNNGQIKSDIDNTANPGISEQYIQQNYQNKLDNLSSTNEVIAESFKDRSQSNNNVSISNSNANTNINTNNNNNNSNNNNNNNGATKLSLYSLIQ